MKTFVVTLILSCLCICASYGQEEVRLFAQGVFQVEDTETILTTENTIRNNPNVSIVRLDPHSKRFFIITQNLNQLSEETLKNWFGTNAESVHCIQIGIHGIDAINTFPFSNCEN
jgi:hypothetical protein